jgi:hypothetical protein
MNNVSGRGTGRLVVSMNVSLDGFLQSLGQNDFDHSWKRIDEEVQAPGAGVPLFRGRVDLKLRERSGTYLGQDPADDEAQRSTCRNLRQRSVETARQSHPMVPWPRGILALPAMPITTSSIVKSPCSANY